ncbi:ATP-binding cassette domain-containing protein [candidate division KSB1 bacterium]|nr:ATP-binding cassette domain-containing protein [candidate division KSB1 bacterium]
MLQLNKLTFSFDDRLLLDSIDWNIQPEMRYSLIGPNGAGKTTLLRLLNGDLQPTSGHIIKSKNYHIGYLPQESILFSGTTVLDSALEARKDLIALEDQIRQLGRAVETAGKDHKAQIEKLGVLQQQYELQGGYRLEADVKSILSGLGFRQNDFRRSLAELSGGWRMRVYLARLLLQTPNLLLLDEPSNHLDLDSLQWLEQYLSGLRSSMIIVSHDRYFIDRLSNEIVELDRGKLSHYPGSYHEYERQKLEHQMLVYKKWVEQQQERQRIQRFVDRFRYKATKAAQVQSRIKQLEKLNQADLFKPDVEPVRFRIEPAYPSYHHVVHMKNLYFRYQQEWVLEDIDLDIYRGQKIALVGPNGAGKTTLTRIIHQELNPQKGEIKVGKRVAIGYYAQHQIDALELDQTPYKVIENVTESKNIPHIRDVLGLFGIRGEKVNKVIGILSGGEKARVSLAKIFLSSVNFLIMDEPTNHLDLATKQALEETLSAYQGTLLLVSHDRYFLDKIVHKIVQVRPDGLMQYEGNYTEYLEKHLKEGQANDNAGKPFESGNRKKMHKRLKAQARQQVSKERSELQQRVARLENEINNLEHRKHELEAELSKPENYSKSAKIKSLQTDYEIVKRNLKHAYGDWEEATLKLEQLLEKLEQQINALDVS